MPSGTELLIWMICFGLFMVIQAFIINGVYYCCQGKCVNELNKGKVCNGNVFYKMFPDFFEESKDKWWAYPLFQCVRCMASFHSLWTYWPCVVWLFGFQWWELYLWLIDMFVLVGLNYLIFKKL